jgi:hypothetical protein
MYNCAHSYKPEILYSMTFNYMKIINMWVTASRPVTADFATSQFNVGQETARRGNFVVKLHDIWSLHRLIPIIWHEGESMASAHGWRQRSVTKSCRNDGQLQFFSTVSIVASTGFQARDGSDKGYTPKLWLVCTCFLRDFRKPIRPPTAQIQLNNLHKS